MADNTGYPSVLVVEDDFHIAHHIASSLLQKGCTVVGPAPDEGEALSLMASQPVDFAILDIKLGSTLVFPVAAALREARVPFVFATGSSRATIPNDFRDVPIWEKPFRIEDLTAHLPEPAPDTGSRMEAGSTASNVLLGALAPSDAAALRPHMSRTALAGDFSPERERVVVFPETGLCSMVVAAGERAGFEIAMIGREGAVGAAVWSAADGLPFACRWLEGSEALVIASAPFDRALASSEPLRLILSEFRRSLAIQMAWTAYAGSCLALHRRVARWVLMAADRMGDHVAVTHADIAAALGVRRAGVTLGLHLLEGEGLVRSKRSLVTVRDRAGLESLVGQAYGEAERAYGDRICREWNRDRYRRR